MEPMKKSTALMLFIAISAFLLSCGGETAKSKKRAQSSFETMFPDIRNAKWNSLNDTIWIASFTYDTKEMTTAFNSLGAWLKTKTNVLPENLPQVVIDRIDGFYYGYVITRSFFAESPDHWAYEIDIDVNTKKIKLLIADNGALLKAQPLEQAESY